MKTCLPYAYDFSRSRPDRKRPVWSTGLDTVVVDMPEIAFAETDLVATVGYRREGDGGVPIKTVDYRSWNGELIAPVLCNNLEPFRLDWLPSAFGGMSQNPAHFDYLDHVASLYGLFSYDEKLDRVLNFLRGRPSEAADYLHGSERALSGLLESRRDVHRLIVEKLAGDLVVVHRSLWRRVDKLCFRLDTRNPTGPFKLDFRSSGFGYHSGPPDRERYPAWDRTFDPSHMERARFHAGNRGLVNLFTHLEVDHGRVIPFNAERDFILNSMDYALFKSSDTVGDMPRKTSLDWAALRDTVARLKQDDSAEITSVDFGHFRVVADSTRSSDASLVKQAFLACEEYVNDPW